jgi:hypothetical protein
MMISRGARAKERNVEEESIVVIIFSRESDCGVSVVLDRFTP